MYRTAWRMVVAPTIILTVIPDSCNEAVSLDLHLILKPSHLLLQHDGRKVVWDCEFSHRAFEVDASWKSYSHSATCTLQNVCFFNSKVENRLFAGKSWLCYMVFSRWAWAGPNPRQSLGNVSHGKASTSTACTSSFNVIVVCFGNTIMW